MIRFAELVNPEYSIYKRTGLKEGMPIANQTAAARIVADMIQDGYYIDFVETLIRIDREGYMGHQYNFLGLNNVAASLIQDGFSFDNVSGQFFENQDEHISVNWGRLQEEEERNMAVLRLDIAGNSELVRNNPRPVIERAYKDIRNIFHSSVISRLGRLWSWEGDGALAAFLYGQKEKMAIYAGMDTIHELFFYNRIRNPLSSPINIRLGAHTGIVRYSQKEINRLKNETVKQAVSLESLAPNNALCVSYNLYLSMDQGTLDLFCAEKNKKGLKYRYYCMGTEK